MKNYTITAKHELGNKITKLCHEGIYICTEKMFREYLENIGIIIQGKSHVRYTLTWEDRTKNEQEIINYIDKKYDIKLEELLATIDYDRFFSYFSSSHQGINVEILTEEILHPNLEQSALEEKIASYLNKISTQKEQQDLIITDPWFLHIEDDTQKRLVQLLKNANIKNMKIYTQKHGEKDNFSSKLNAVNINHTIYKTNIFHDRFWIMGDCGFVVGTSFNTIGEKIALIDYLSSNDVKTICNLIEENKPYEEFT